MRRAPLCESKRFLDLNGTWKFAPLSTRSDQTCFVLFCDFNVFQCMQNYPTTHEAWSQTWQLVIKVITWWPFDAFWIEVICVVDSFQLLHGIPFRWRPSIESGPRGGTKPYWQYDAICIITSSPWFVVDALEMFPNLLRLKKKQAQLVSRC